jgi:hypothetical protein
MSHSSPIGVVKSRERLRWQLANVTHRRAPKSSARVSVLGEVPVNGVRPIPCTASHTYADRDSAPYVALVVGASS